MPSASRINDATSGHGCFPPQTVVAGSSDVLINGIPAARVGDAVTPHTCVVTHPGTIAIGSSTVFINGVPAARIGDPIDCGSTLVGGSSNVNIGG